MTRRLFVRSLLAFAVLASLTLSLAPASSAKIPIVGGGGGGGGGGGTPPPGSAIDPPAGGSVFEGEALPAVTIATDGNAHAGRLGRTTRASIASGLSQGTYRLTTRVRALSGGRADLLVDDDMAGSYGIGNVWTTIEALVHIDGPTSTIGVGSWIRSGTPNAIDIDWLQISGAAVSIVTQGNKVIAPNGTAVVFRGVNQGDYQDPPTSGTYYAPPLEGAQMYAWGINMVRVGVSQEKWLNRCPTQQNGVLSDYKTVVTNVINDLTSHGVVALLTLASTDRGENPGCDATTGILREMADTRSITFWQQAAGLFKSNAMVAFDLFNEPHGLTDNQWRNGGQVVYGKTATGQNKSFTAVGMQGLYNTVRGQGARNLIFVSGQAWASDPRVMLTSNLDGYGFIAATHSYCHQCQWNQPALPSDIDTLNSPELRARHPYVLDEAGWQYNTSGLNRKFIDWAEARGAGWLIYAWLQPKPDGYPDTYSLVNNRDPILDAGGGTMVRPPSMAGAPVWNSLQATRVARGYDALPMSEN